MQESPEPPRAPQSAPTVFDAPGQVPRAVVGELARTRPWIIVIAVLASLAAGAAFLGGLSALPPLATAPAARGPAPEPLVAAGFALYALLFCLPAWRLWKLASAIASLKASHAIEDFEAVLRAQRRFWKLIGVLVIVFTGLFFLSVFGAYIYSGTVNRYR